MSADTAVLYKGGLVFEPSGKNVPGMGVLVEDGKISRIAPVAQFDGYQGSVHDTSTGTLMPGLIDCHVHILYAGESNPSGALTDMLPGELVVRSLENASKTLRGGVTSVRDCGGKDYLEFAVRDASNSGRFLGPTIRAAGQMICMTGGHGNRFGRVADGVDDVVRAVREQVHAGSDLIKIMATGGVMTRGVNPEDAHYSAEEMAAGIHEANRFHKTTASHAQGAEGILNATRGGVTSIEHGIFMDDECIAEMLERGTFVVPTLAAVANIVAHKNAGIAPYVMEKAERVYAIHRVAIKKFSDAGGKIAMGTDAGTPFNLHGANSDELKLMVDIGMSTTQALIASTATAADLMRLSDRGRIVEGAAADFLIVDGDPIQQIEKVSDRNNHRCVVKNGALLSGDKAMEMAAS